MRHRNNLQTGAYISWVVFILMLFGAIYYYSERMFFSDASYIAFNAINEQKIQVQQFRFGAFITQIVPVICAKMGVSVKSILMAYSGSFHFFYLIVASVLLFGFKAYRFVILFAFYWVLITTETFFWPNNEVHQGIAYMFLLFPALIHAGEKKYHFGVPVIFLLLLGTTAIFCHPLVMPAFIFLWVYLIADKTDWHYSRGQTIVLSSIALFIIAAKMYVSTHYASYDTGKLAGVSHMHIRDVAGSFTSPFARALYSHVLSNYWILPILSVVGVAHLVVKRKLLLAVWTLGCGVVFFILLCLTFPDYSDFFTESELMAGIIILATPFVFVTLASLRKEYVTVILLFILAARLINFQGSNAYFTQRVQQLAEVLAKMKTENLSKVILVKTDDHTDPKWSLDWGFAAESALLSASVWDKPVRQFAVVGQEELPLREPKNNTDVVLSFGNWPIDKIDLSLFPFDTTRPYTVVPYDDFLK